MSLVTAVTWSRQPVSDPTAADVIRYGPDVATEAELRLLGHVAEKRVLELGCGSGAGSVAAALQGARAIGVDFSAQLLSAARRLSERSGVKLELHEGELGDLAFARADTVDVVFSVYALNLVEDINRVFRQVHRVLKPGGPLVFSVPHPAYDMIVDDDLEEPLLIRRSYFDDGRIDLGADAPPYFSYHHTISDLFTGLLRANFRVDAILEPEPRREGRGSPHWREASRFVPRTLIMRARKEGS
ncbi:MAG TPA: methyltransferase domain-containing protein [Acidimicrobiales bacterium]|nr:methyltransferase domain-containing protein [Acidimicrobiales bacterium]